MTMAPRITGILETCLYVADMERSRRFYEEILGLKVMTGDRRIVTFDMAAAQVLILFQRGETDRPVRVGKGVIPAHDGDGRIHFALAIPPGSHDSWKAHLVSREVAVEGEVEWPKGGRSLYFRDPDGHLVELATPGLWSNY